ncbi:MAG: methionyl-tRNA formyltransferase [Corallococcus sp.]|nr:methionyl-tRNA formyltransferase [Corallococcus sp.]MCM1359148.1 methionyl-tRNA formyltransferase [Corallococcus sp.]MCM1394538.1 methionyl-tRNA formyltransferase [Corallococcus sp.]
MKVIFLGTPDFGIPALTKIMQNHQLLACVAQPDKAGARGKVEFSPVKKFAIEHGIPLYQFEKISRDGVEILQSLAPDIMVTAAYGQILSQQVIDIPRYGIINIHGSLLPELRGAAPIQYAVLKGFKQTGVTILNTVRQVDAGDIILQKSLDILPYENSGHLFDRLAELGAEAVTEALSQIENGTAIYTPQSEEKATFSAKISAEQEQIDWNESAENVVNLIRALSPNIGAHTYWNGTLLKIFDARFSDRVFDSSAGTVVECGKKTLAVMCGDGKAVEIKVLQLENSKRLDVSAFLCGKKIDVGTVLGN